MKRSGIKAVAIIPAHNEEKTIAKVILQTMRFVDSVLVCDDGSTDMTPMIAKAVGASVVSHEKKQGKGEAFKTLFEEVMKLNPDIVVALDADGQHDPDQIPMLMKPIETEKCDLVVGSRYVSGGKMDAPLYRRVGLKVVNFMYRKFAGVHTKDTQSGFRAYSQKAFNYLINCDAKGYGVDAEQLVLASRNGLKVMEVPIFVKYESSRARNLKRSPMLHGADLISTLFRIVAEERPLKYLGLPGIALTCIGMMLGLYSLSVFNATRYFSIPVVILTVGTSIMGMLLVIAAITFHGLKRIEEKLNKSNAVNQ